jgi:CRP-like cAMP-binding protein
MAWMTTKRSMPGEVFRDLPLFGACGTQELKRLDRLGTRLTVRAGRHLMVAGHLGTEVLIVLAGRAACFVEDEEVASFGPGDFFGEIALLDGGPRTATVIASTDMEVLVLTQFEFKLMINLSPEIAHRMLRSLAHRLRKANVAAVA